MQMLCKVSSPFADVCCPLCGQGFMVYWTRNRANEREEQQHSLELALRAQHGALSTPDAHAPAFQVPEAPAMLPQRLRTPIRAEILPVYS